MPPGGLPPGPTNRAPSGAGYVTPERPIAPPGSNQGTPDYVHLRRPVLPPGTPRPEVDETQNAGLALLGQLPGLVGSALVPSAVPALNALDEVIHRPQEVGQRLAGMPGIIREPVVRALQIPERINRPVDQAEAQVMADTRDSQLRAYGVHTPDEAVGADKFVGQEPSLGLRLRRAAGEMALAPLEILGQTFMETAGRLYGAARAEGDRQNQKIQDNIQAAIQSGQVTPEEAQQVQQYFQTKLPPADPRILEIANSLRADVDANQLVQQVAHGRESFENLNPLEQIVASFALAPFDPLNIASGLGRNARLFNTAEDAFSATLRPSGRTLEQTLEAARLGRPFEGGFLARTLGRLPGFRRLPETNARLMAASALGAMDSALVRANSAAERMEILGLFGKYAAGDATWADDAARYGLRRTVTAEEAQQLARFGVRAGDLISPVESETGQMTAAVLRQMMQGGGKFALNALLDTIATGEKAARDQAAAQILERLVRASNEVVGVQPRTGLLAQTQRALSEYQGFMAQWFQLNTPGTAIRNGMANFTSAIADDVLGYVRPSFFENAWKGPVGTPEAVKRGVGVGFEQGGGLAGAIARKGKLGQFVANTLGGGWAKRLNANIEDLFSAGAWKKGADFVFDNGWRRGPILPDELAAHLQTAIGAENAGALDAAARAAWNPGQLDDIARAIQGDELWRLPPAAYQDFVAAHPELFDALQNAQSADDFRAAVRSLELDWRNAALEQKITLPPDDGYAAILRQKLAGELGLKGQALDRAVAQELAFRADNRVPSELAQAWANYDIQQLPAEGRAEWAQRYQALDREWERIAQETAAEAVVARKGALDAGGDWQPVVQRLWKDYFTRKEEAFHNLREAIPLADDARLPADLVRPAVPETPAAPEVPAPARPTGQLPPNLAGAKPRYGYGGRNFQLVFDSDVDRALYTIANPGTSSKREAEFLAWLKTQYPDLSEAELRAMGRALRDRIKTFARDALAGEDVLRVPAGGTPSVRVAEFALPSPEAPPDPALYTKLTLPVEVKNLRQFSREVLKNWGNQYGGIPAEQLPVFQEALNLYRARLGDIRQVANRVGTILRDGTFFNYGDLREFDLPLKMLFAYPTWYTRQAGATARRYLTNPHFLWAMLNMRQKLAEYNDGQDMPPWLKNNLTLSLGEGGLLSFPILRQFDPGNEFFETEFAAPEQQGDPLGRAYLTLNQFGPGSVHSLIPQVLGALAYAAGKKDLAYSYASRLGLTSQLIENVTGFAPESVVPFPQYQLLFTDTPAGRQFVGTRYDRNQVIKELQRMTQAGEITSQEQFMEVLALVNDPYNPKYADDPAYAEAWRIFTQALTNKRQRGLFTNLPDGTPWPGPTLQSWGIGPTGSYRDEIDLAILRASQAYSDLYQRKGQLTPEEYRAAQRAFWSDPANQQYSLYGFGKRTGRERDEAYAWSVLSRVSRGRVDNAYYAAAGMDADLLSQFYENGGIPAGWTTQEYDRFLGAVNTLGAALALPDLATAREWDAAGARRKAYQTAWERTFTEEERALFDNYLAAEDRTDYRRKHPEVERLIDFEWQFLLNDRVDPNTLQPTTPDVPGGVPGRDTYNLLAAYYATDRILYNRELSLFNAAHAEAKRNYDFYLELRAIGQNGDDIDKAIASDYYAEHKEEFTQFKADRAEFYAGLDQRLAEFKNLLPDPKLPELRTDTLEGGQYVEAVQAARTAQAEGETAEAPVEAAESDALQYNQSQRARVEAERAARDANTSYFDVKVDGVTGRDTYELTLNSHFQGTQAFRDNPELAQQAFEAVTGDWSEVRPNTNFAAYLGEFTDFRQALLFDTTGRWQTYVAALRQMDESQVDRSIPGLWPAWVQAQQWNGISEAARADIAGANVTFNIDGTVSVTRQSANKYFNGSAGGGGGSGGYVAPSGGGTGGRGRRGEWPEGRDPNKYYGGEGPDIPGFPRYDIPYGGQYGPQPRYTHRQYGGGWGGWSPDSELAAADNFAQTLANLPESLRLGLISFFASPPDQQAAILESTPGLREWLLAQGAGVGVLRAGWAAWAARGGTLESVAVGPPDNRQSSGFGPVVRVYPRRSAESPL